MLTGPAENKAIARYAGYGIPLPEWARDKVRPVPVGRRPVVVLYTCGKDGCLHASVEEALQCLMGRKEG